MVDTPDKLLIQGWDTVTLGARMSIDVRLAHKLDRLKFMWLNFSES